MSHLRFLSMGELMAMSQPELEAFRGQLAVAIERMEEDLRRNQLDPADDPEWETRARKALHLAKQCGHKARAAVRAMNAQRELDRAAERAARSAAPAQPEIVMAAPAPPKQPRPATTRPDIAAIIKATRAAAKVVGAAEVLHGAVGAFLADDSDDAWKAMELAWSDLGQQLGIHAAS